MIEERIRLPSPESANPSYAYIQRRIDATSDEIQERTIRALGQASNSRRGAFRILARELSDERTRYESLEELKERDLSARRRASQTLPTETAARTTLLKREDIGGASSAFEFLLLTILSLEEWQTLCKEIEKLNGADAEAGGFLVRDVIQNVLSDEPRTKKFIDATRTTVEKFGNESITVYDVGCGPFPILAIAAVIYAKRATVRCIEINPVSAKIAEAVVQKLGLEKWIAVETGNALSAPPPEPDTVHIVVSETVGPGLFSEKVAQILPRFASCLKREGVLIPSQARLTAAVMPHDYSKALREGMGQELVINTNGEEMLVLPETMWHPFEEGAGVDLAAPPHTVSGTVPFPDIPVRDFDRHYSLVACAELVLDQDGTTILPKYESSPTSPVILGNGIIVVPKEYLDRDPKDLEIHFSYEPGSDATNASYEVQEKQA